MMWISAAIRPLVETSFYERFPARHERSVEMINSRPDPRVSAWVLARDETTLYLSSIIIGELRKGLISMPAGKRRTQLDHGAG